MKLRDGTHTHDSSGGGGASLPPPAAGAPGTTTAAPAPPVGPLLRDMDVESLTALLESEIKQRVSDFLLVEVPPALEKTPLETNAEATPAEKAQDAAFAQRQRHPLMMDPNANA